MRHRLLRMSQLAARGWCALMHDQITWPVKGTYRCRVCGREYEISWAPEADDSAAPSVPPAAVSDGLEPQTERTANHNLAVGGKSPLPFSI